MVDPKQVRNSSIPSRNFSMILLVRITVTMIALVFNGSLAKACRDNGRPYLGVRFCPYGED